MPLFAFLEVLAPREPPAALPAAGPEDASLRLRCHHADIPPRF